MPSYTLAKTPGKPVVPLCTIQTNSYSCSNEGNYGTHVRRLKPQLLTPQGTVAGSGEALLFDAYQIGNDHLAIAFEQFNADEILCHEVMGTRLDPEQFSVLVLNKLEIAPTYRGHRFGIQMIQSCLEEAKLYAEQALLALMHPCPLQWRTRQEQEEGERALSRYYRKHLPLKRIKKTPYYYLNAL